MNVQLSLSYQMVYWSDSIPLFHLTYAVVVAKTIHARGSWTRIEQEFKANMFLSWQPRGVFGVSRQQAAASGE